jgi:ATP-dependent 26S proteasome regulatory subunit
MNAAIQSVISAYKRDVAGAYRSLAPDRIDVDLPPGACVVSEKIDGETWFLHGDGERCVLWSPFGKLLADIPLTDEAQRTLHGWRGLLAGELYASVDSGRPRVFDLHAAMGGRGNPDRLRFAAFDVLMDGDDDLQRRPFTERLDRLQRIVGHSEGLFHLAPSETVETPAELAACYESIVTVGGAEGIVIHAADGRTYKVKPEIIIDAAVIGYAANDSGVSELLLALVKPDGVFQLIGRAKTGWSRAESHELSARLAPLACASTYRKANDHGLLYRWVKPQLVVEIKCNDLIIANSKDEPVRRMALRYEDQSGWSPLGPAPSVSMINTVFRRVREDKRAVRPDVRIGQVSDLVPVVEQTSIDPASLPASEIFRREVYTKKSPRGLALRKLVAWKTNKRESDPAYPNYVVFFTDYAPGRKQPLKTDLRVAASEATMHAFADDWLAANIKRGWEQVSSDDCRTTNEHNPAGIEETDPVIRHPESTRHFKIAFARSSSPTFPIIRKRLDALAKLGSLEITKDDSGREAWFELSITHGLVENAKRIDSLLKIVKAWKTTEVSLDGNLIGKHDLQDFINNIEDTRHCWLKRKKQGRDACKRDCMLGCSALNIWFSHEWLNHSGCDELPWWAVGAFEGERVVIDKDALKHQIDAERNEGVRLCPHFDRYAVLGKIEALPDAIEANADGWITLYSKDREAAWLWPADTKTPPTLRTTKDNPWRTGGLNIRVGFEKEIERSGDSTTDELNSTSSVPQRTIPPTRYADVQGQDKAVEAVRDLIELPLRHADLFTRIGATPRAGGVILAGPPGTGKTLLARAVAGECGAHVETVSGPELLSKWVGETEAALRSIFERAKTLAPSVILFDEIDCLAVSRGSADAQYQKSMVTQLLALLDGLEERGNIFVIATTNRPDDIDPALRRPGRFDRIVTMGPPDEAGRAAIFRHYLEPLVIDPALDPDRLATELASLTPGLTGADIAHVCQSAARLCVKDAVGRQSLPDAMAIREEHFRRSLARIQVTDSSRKTTASASSGVFRKTDTNYLMSGTARTLRS